MVHRHRLCIGLVIISGILGWLSHSQQCDLVSMNSPRGLIDNGKLFLQNYLLERDDEIAYDNSNYNFSQAHRIADESHKKFEVAIASHFSILLTVANKMFESNDKRTRQDCLDRLIYVTESCIQLMPKHQTTWKRLIIMSVLGFTAEIALIIGLDDLHGHKAQEFLQIAHEATRVIE